MDTKSIKVRNYYRNFNVESSKFQSTTKTRISGAGDTKKFRCSASCPYDYKRVNFINKRSNPCHQL